MRYILPWLYVGPSEYAFGQTNITALGSAVQDALSSPRVWPHAFGKARRSAGYGLGMQPLDFALVRDFTVAERARLTFRAKVFNRLNRLRLAAVAAGLRDQLSATISF